MRLAGFVVGLGAMLFLASAGEAAPVFNPANGHYYEYFQQFTSWREACSMASTLSHAGLSGHLATFTTTAERDFVRGILAPGTPGVWVGGYQPPGTGEPSSGWRWVTNEAFSPAFWCAGEPIGVGCGGGVEEDVTEYVRDQFINDSNCLNDLSWCVCRAFIVEYDGIASECGVIEEGNCPATCSGTPTCLVPRAPGITTVGLVVLLLSMGWFAGVMLIRRRPASTPGVR
jgi:hypothetical protein